MANTIVHWEIMGENADKLKAFYAGIFDWQPTATPGFDNYHMVPPEQAGIGGAVGTGPEAIPSYLTFYVQVPSIDELLAKVEGSGGRTIMPRTVIPGTVTFGLFSDPAGNIVGLVEEEMPAEE